MIKQNPEKNRTFSFRLNLFQGSEYYNLKKYFKVTNQKPQFTLNPLLLTSTLKVWINFFAKIFPQEKSFKFSFLTCRCVDFKISCNGDPAIDKNMLYFATGFSIIFTVKMNLQSLTFNCVTMIGYGN